MCRAECPSVAEWPSAASRKGVASSDPLIANRRVIPGEGGVWGRHCDRSCAGLAHHEGASCLCKTDADAAVEVSPPRLVQQGPAARETVGIATVRDGRQRLMWHAMRVWVAFACADSFQGQDKDLLVAFAVRTGGGAICFCGG